MPSTKVKTIIALVVIMLFFNCCKKESAWEKASRQVEEGAKKTAQLMDNPEARAIRAKLAEEARLAALPPKISPKDAERTIEKKAAVIIGFLNNGEIEKVLDTIHPKKGIFIVNGIYGYLNPYFAVDKKKFLEYWNGTQPVLFNPPGPPNDPGVEFDLREFVKRRFFKNYHMADMVGYNTIIHPANDYDMIFYNRPEWIVVEYYFKDGHSKGFWAAPRLIFEEYAGKWYLLGMMNILPEID